MEFNPAAYLTKLKGKDYLEVKHRLLWMRTEHPDAAIATELVQLDVERQFALFKATVRIPNGGEATGWGSETGKDFGDYIEKGETKALGRALAALGFGTQFTEDFEFSANARNGETKVVDSPIDRSQHRGNNTGNPLPQGVKDENGDGEKATEAQVKAMFAIAKTLNYDSDQFTDYCQKRFGAKPVGLSKATATKLIDYMKKNNALPPLKTEGKAEAKPPVGNSVPESIDPNARIPESIAKTAYETAMEELKLDKVEVKTFLKDSCGVERFPDLTFAGYAKVKAWLDGKKKDREGVGASSGPTGFENI